MFLPTWLSGRLLQFVMGIIKVYMPIEVTCVLAYHLCVCVLPFAASERVYVT